MGMYYFHLYDDMIVMDEEGAAFSGPAAARAKALKIAREMACAEVLHGHLDLSHRIEVVDEHSQPVATVHFGDTVEVKS